jgi:hypothetical protein
MPHDDPIHNEDWYDEDTDDNSADFETGHCPECRAPVYEFTDKCPACGYWLTAADRRLWPSESKPKWVLITATIILVVLLLGVLSMRF